MNMGPCTNGTQLNFTQDPRSAFTSQGSRMQGDDENRREEAVPPPSRFDVNDLAKTVTSFGDRIVLMRDIAKYTTKRADERASELMKGRFNAVSATGEVDTVRYGHILRAGELGGLAGSGASYNGDDYSSPAGNRMRRDKYITRFSSYRGG